MWSLRPCLFSSTLHRKNFFSAVVKVKDHLKEDWASLYFKLLFLTRLSIALHTPGECTCIFLVPKARTNCGERPWTFLKYQYSILPIKLCGTLKTSSSSKQSVFQDQPLFLEEKSSRNSPDSLCLSTSLLPSVSISLASER